MTIQQSKQRAIRILRARRQKWETARQQGKAFVRPGTYISDIDVCDWSDYQRIPMPPGWRNVHIPGA